MDLRGWSFGNAYKNHPLANEAGKVGVVAQQQIFDAVIASEVAWQKVFATAVEAAQSDVAQPSGPCPDGAPQLAVPQGGVASLIALAGLLQRAMLDGNVDALKADAALWGTLSDAQRRELNELQSAYDSASNAQGSASHAEAQAHARVDAAQAALARAQQGEGARATELEQAKKHYEDAVAGHAPQEQLDSLKATWDSAKQTMADATAAVAKARPEVQRASEALLAARSASAHAASDAKIAGDKLNGAIQRSFNASTPDIRPGSSGGDKLTGAAAVTLLMGKLNMLCAKAAEDKLESDRELFEEQQKATQAKALKESQEYEEQVRKAEAMQKAMGCIGKILGAIITVFSVVAAAFTGGASLAIAGIGLALFAADQIGQAATGKSFLSEALQPLMDNVLKPLMNFLSNIVTKALEACGVDKEKASLAGAIIGGVLSGVVLIVAAVVGGSIVSSVLSKLMSAVSSQLAKMAESAVMKALSQAMDAALEKTGVKALASKIASGMERVRVAVGADTPEGAQLVQTRIKQATQGVQIVNTSSQSGLNVAAGFAEKDADEAIAKMKIALADNKFLRQLMSTAIDTYTESMKAHMHMVQTAFATLDHQRTTLLSEYAAIRRA
ncbi:hypothetical protein WJ69_34270 [Burkholderia ubonensis]|nr:hypothetical protein WJ69_34270 [Burkholderia ubonensis]